MRRNPTPKVRKLSGRASTRTTAPCQLDRSSVGADNPQTRYRHPERAAGGGYGIYAVEQRPDPQEDAGEDRHVGDAPRFAGEPGDDELDRTPEYVIGHHDEQKIDGERHGARG